MKNWIECVSIHSVWLFTALADSSVLFVFCKFLCYLSFGCFGWSWVWHWSSSLPPCFIASIFGHWKFEAAYSKYHELVSDNFLLLLHPSESVCLIVGLSWSLQSHFWGILRFPKITIWILAAAHYSYNFLPRKKISLKILIIN